MVRLFAFLLVIFLILFFGPSLYTDITGDALQVANVPIQNIPELQTILGGGIAFFQIAIVIFSILDRAADTFKFIIRPFAAFISLIIFLGVMYRTFAPILVNFVPQQAAQAMGVQGADPATHVISSQFAAGILFTLGTMLFFLLAYRALTEESDQVKRLRSEIAKLRRAL